MKAFDYFDNVKSDKDKQEQPKETVQIQEEAKQKLDIQDDTINYIPTADLKKYLEVTNRFISNDAKEVVNYLIVNNDHYVKDLSDGNDVENYDYIMVRKHDDKYLFYHQ